MMLARKICHRCNPDVQGRMQHVLGIVLLDIKTLMLTVMQCSGGCCKCMLQQFMCMPAPFGKDLKDA